MTIPFSGIENSFIVKEYVMDSFEIISAELWKYGQNDCKNILTYGSFMRTILSISLSITELQYMYKERFLITVLTSCDKSSHKTLLQQIALPKSNAVILL